MRDIFIFLIVFALLPFALFRPAIGILLFTWVSLMNPHRLTYGAAYDFPFASIIAVVTLFGLFISRQSKNMPFTQVTIVLIIFMLWMTFTSFLALEPNLVWIEWNRVMKTLFMTLLAILILNTEKDIKAFAWVIGLSLGFYGIKGGIFTLSSGGSNHVFGPEGSYIGDNNALALALVTTLPIIWYLQLHTERKWLRIVLTGIAILTVISAAGSYSRGALIAGVMMLFLLWLKNRNKFRHGILFSLIVAMLYTVMPEEWFIRMDTIDNYQEDDSALGRINAWNFAMNVAKNNLLGGGFNVFTHKMFLVYAPEPYNHHAAHSIYFQVLGEHGFIGLFLYLILMLLAWRTGARIIKRCKGKKELQWASDLAAMSQVSMIGFAVGGAFLTLAYYDLYFDIIALLVILEKITMPETAIMNEKLLQKTSRKPLLSKYEGDRS